MLSDLTLSYLIPYLSLPYLTLPCELPWKHLSIHGDDDDEDDDDFSVSLVGRTSLSLKPQRLENTVILAVLLAEPGEDSDSYSVVSRAWRTQLACGLAKPGPQGAIEEGKRKGITKKPKACPRLRAPMAWQSLGKRIRTISLQVSGLRLHTFQLLRDLRPILLFTRRDPLQCVRLFAGISED